VSCICQHDRHEYIVGGGGKSAYRRAKVDGVLTGLVLRVTAYHPPAHLCCVYYYYTRYCPHLSLLPTPISATLGTRNLPIQKKKEKLPPARDARTRAALLVPSHIPHL
jgi:hypothetical protein